MAYHPRATPNFRNLVVRPMWTTLRAALRTVPIIGPRFFSTGYHSKKAQMLDEETKRRIGEAHSDGCLLYTSPSPRDRQKSRMPSSA